MTKTKFFSKIPTESKHIRTEVFSKEQGFLNEFDETDETAIHIILFEDEKAVGTARMFWDDEIKNAFHLGRIAILKECRGRHFGSIVVNEMIEKAKQLGAKECILGAQVSKKDFYISLGFEEFGEIFFDEGCPHIMMKKEIKQ